MDVVVTTGEQSNRWSRQFARQPHWTLAEASRAGLSASPRSRTVHVLNSSTRQGIVDGITHAAHVAGRGGRVIYSIGHGYGGRTGSNVMLANNGTFTITEAILQGDHTVESGHASIVVRLTPDNADIRAKFVQIGANLTRSGIGQFVFLVCGLGASPSFMGRVKAAWGGRVQIGAFSDGVTLQDDTMQGDATYPRTRLYLYRDGAADPGRLGTGTSAIPVSWLEMPAGMVMV